MFFTKLLLKSLLLGFPKTFDRNILRFKRNHQYESRKYITENFIKFIFQEYR